MAIVASFIEQPQYDGSTVKVATWFDDVSGIHTPRMKLSNPEDIPGFVPDTRTLAGLDLTTDRSAADLRAAMEVGWWNDQEPDGVATMPRHVASSGSMPTTSGSLRLGYFTARKSLIATKVRTSSGATAAGATPTLVRFGIYTVDGAGDLTLVASTTNDTTLLASTNTLYEKALSSSYGVVAGTRFAIGVLVVTAAAAPTIVGTLIGSGSTHALTAAAPRLSGLVSGQSDLPSSISAGSLTNSASIPYHGLIP